MQPGGGVAAHQRVVERLPDGSLGLGAELLQDGADGAALARRAGLGDLDQVAGGRLGRAPLQPPGHRALRGAALDQRLHQLGRRQVGEHLHLGRGRRVVPLAQQVAADGPDAERGERGATGGGLLDQAAVGQQRQRLQQLRGQRGGDPAHLDRAGRAGDLVGLQDAPREVGGGHAGAYGVDRGQHLGQVAVDHGRAGQAVVGAVEHVHHHAVPELQRGLHRELHRQRPARGTAAEDLQQPGVDGDDPDEAQPPGRQAEVIGRGGRVGLAQVPLGAHLAVARPGGEPDRVGDERHRGHRFGQLRVGCEEDRRERQRLVLHGSLLRGPWRHGGLLIDQLAQLGEVEDIVCHPRNLLHTGHMSVLNGWRGSGL